MQLENRTSDGKMEINLLGSLDELGARELGEFFEKIDPKSVSEVVVDFAAVTYLGSAGVGKLLLLYKKMALAGGQVILSRLPAQIYTLLAKDMNLGEIFVLQKG